MRLLCRSRTSGSGRASDPRPSAVCGHLPLGRDADAVPAARELCGGGAVRGLVRNALLSQESDSGRGRRPGEATDSGKPIRIVAVAAVVAFSISPLASSTDSGAAGAGTPLADSRAQGVSARVSAPERCPDHRRGLSFYRQRHGDWLKLRGVHATHTSRAPRSCPDARYLAKLWRSRSFTERQATERWIEVRTLRDFRVTPGSRAWPRAVREAQRAFPGTEAWLLSCSASEGGWGRWVPNSDGASPGGWLQFMPGTFWRMWATAHSDVRARGYRVPQSAASWYSPLGQALAGAWGLTNGRRHEWAGSGCR